MAITTMAKLASSLVTPYRYIKVQTVTPVIGQWYSLWTYGGMPAAGAIPTGNLKGQFFTNTSPVTGQIWTPGAVAGDTLYLSAITCQANTPGTLVLADRIWSDSLPVGPTILGAGANLIFSGSFPRSGGLAAGDSSGRNVHIGMEVFATLGANSVTLKATVINDQGAGDTLTTWSAIPASAVAGTFVPMYGNRHAYGVKSVSNFHCPTTHTSGAWGLTAFRVIARVGCPFAGIEGSIDAISSGFPEIFPNAVPMLFWIAGSTTAAIPQGRIQWAFG